MKRLNRGNVLVHIRHTHKCMMKLIAFERVARTTRSTYMYMQHVGSWESDARQFVDLGRCGTVLGRQLVRSAEVPVLRLEPRGQVFEMPAL